MINREFDKTQLRENSHGAALHRDYSAHFFRYSFVRRFVNNTMDILDIGCGQDKPISKILTAGPTNLCNKYVGVDLNGIKPSNNKRLTFHEKFNFVERYNELLELYPEKFDVVISLESIEHMLVEHGNTLLKGTFELLKSGGHLIISTPCYDGRRMAKNHIHEWTVEELQNAIEHAGLIVKKRFGTFMDIKHIGKDIPIGGTEVLNAINVLKTRLNEYYDNDAISCIFAPLYPDNARNNLWVCKKP